MATSASQKIAKSPISSPSNDSSSSPPPPPPPPPPSNSSSHSSSSPPSSSPSTFSPPPSPNQDPSQSSNSTSSSSQVSSPPESSPHGHKNSGREKSSKADSNGEDPSSDNGNHFIINMPFVLGIIGGILAFVIIMIIVACLSRRRKKKSPNGMGFYVDPSIRKANDYYAGGQPQKWGNQDHLVQPHQGLHVPPGGGWKAPPPLMMSSSDMSSGFSGPHGPPLPPPSPTLALGFNKSTFTYDELAAATNGFIQANLLGQGGFGYVHKGVLPNGKEIAVKSLKSGSGQGEREFQAEVDIISRVHHRHLVSLVGYCISGAQRMLVYDFVENKTLEYHLHGKGLPTMDWPTRLKIALGSAKGLAYLHEDCHPRIIHRDIKSANILLDFKFEAMVADFGLAKLSLDNHTHVSTRVMGTFGYLAPEYASSGKLTEKSDIFSYGVMLLELITGRRPCDSSHTFMEDSLVDWARPVLSHALSNGNYDELVDPNLKGNYEPMEMARMVACAAAAVRHSARRRPKMSQIVRALDGDVSLEDLNEGMRPGQSMLFSSGSDYESDFFAASMRRNMRKVPIASPEYSDEFNEVSIPEYGHHRGSSSSSDVAFSEELNAIGNQRLRAHSPL